MNVDRIDKFKFHISGSHSNHLQFSIPYLTIFCSYSQYLIPHRIFNNKFLHKFLNWEQFLNQMILNGTDL